MGSNITFFIYSGNESTDSGHHSGTAKKCVKTDSNSSSPIGKISDHIVFCFEKRSDLPREKIVLVIKKIFCKFESECRKFAKNV